MEIDRKELKRQARERMALTDPKFWMVALVYLAMTIGVSWLVSLIPFPATGASSTPTLDAFPLFLRLLLKLYATVVQFGLCLWALWTWRQLDPGLNSLTQGFSVAGRVIFMELGIYVRILGWYFLIALGLSIPMIALLLTAGYVLGMTALFLFSVALLAVLIALSLRYALAPYLLADRPDDGAIAPIGRSLSLMRGWKMELFKLEFSFVGWDILNLMLSFAVILFFLSNAGLLTPEAFASETWRDQCFALLFSAPVSILSTLVTIPLSLWLLPYRATARAGFYDARVLAARQDSKLPEIPPL